MHGTGITHVKKYLDGLLENTCIYKYELETAKMLLNSSMYGHLSSQYMEELKKKSVMNNPSES